MAINLPKIFSFLLVLAGASGLYLLHMRFQMPSAGFGVLHSIVFYFSVLLLTTGCSLLVGLLFNFRREFFFKVGLFLLSTFLCLFVSEIFLRTNAINQSYMERRSNSYYPVYPRRNSNVDFVIEPSSPPFLNSSEYKFARVRNNFGFRDKDFTLKKDSSSILIQTYGDSFTEGDGAQQDSSYPSMLHTIILNSSTPNISVQNFGVCGSDPGFTFRQLQDIGLTFKPDVAVIAYSSFDLTADFFTRGGLERFKDGFWQSSDGPNWEWLYASSYVARLVANSVFGITHTNFFLSEEQKAKRINYLKPKWNETFQRIAELARNNHIQIMLLKKPERSELDNNEYMCDFSFFENIADTISVFKRFDLLPYYRDSLGITEQNSAQYYWPIDGHHNATGYAAMAKSVGAGLKKFYPQLFEKE